MTTEFWKTSQDKSVCPACGKVLRLPPDVGGKQVRCPACHAKLAVSVDMKRLIPVKEPVTAEAKNASLTCPACRKTIRVAADLKGKRTHCRECNALLTVSPNMRDLTVVSQPVRDPQRISAPVSGRPANASRPTSPPSSETPRSPRRKAILWLSLLGFAVIVSAVGGVLFAWKGAGNRSSPSGDDTATARSGVDGLITRDGVITGTMDIDYKTRYEKEKDGTPSRTAQDIYRVDLAVRTHDDAMIKYVGIITRRPLPEDKRAEKERPAGLHFDVNVSAHPLDQSGQSSSGNVRQIGKISGFAPLTADARYLFDALEWRSALGGAVPFQGIVQGKRGKERDKEPRRLSFDRGNEEVIVQIQKPDPMIFQGLQIPTDASLNIAAAKLTGELTFDYDKSSYLTNDLCFAYEKESHRIQGTILWEKDLKEYLYNYKKGDQASNGKSKYVFTLVFNPKPATNKAQRNTLFQGEDRDIVVVAPSLSTLRGSISYWDDGPVEEDEGELYIRPFKSRVQLNLHANRLTADQIHNFLKMWLLMSGPVNDE